MESETADGDTALHVASFNGKRMVVTLLVERGSAIEHRNKVYIVGLYTTVQYVSSCVIHQLEFCSFLTCFRTVSLHCLMQREMAIQIVNAFSSIMVPIFKC